MLIKYMNDKNGNRKGCIVCTGLDPKYRTPNIGLSFCSKYDTFNKARAVEIAAGRAEMHVDPPSIPREMVIRSNFEFDAMLERAAKYYR